jgi:cytochrome c biogenesis protein CcmG/thiol:disulfide interchange protein DsbE
VRRKLVPAITAVLAAAAVGLLVFGVTQQGSSRALDQALAHGRHPAAPDPARLLPALDRVGHADASLASWHGKVLIVNFWASWCATCINEAPLIERAQRSLAATGAGTVVGIDFKDISSGAQRYIRSYGLSYPNLRDIDGSFAAAYGTDALPETFVLDRRLRVVAIWRGPIQSEAQLRAWIAEAQRA